MNPRAASGFTLVELLVVLCVIGILAGLTIPAVSMAMRGSSLAQATQKVTVEISLARQTALAEDRTVEVRFYRVAKAGMPGEVSGNPATGKFRALQSFVYDSSGNAKALDKVQWLPDTIIIDSNATLSTLLGSTLSKTWTSNDPQVALPNVGTAYTACAFDFQPDGSTNLNPIGQQWYVTLHGFAEGDNRSSLPANFNMLQVDPLNGHIQPYQPQ